MPSSSLVLSVGAFTLSTLLAPVTATLYGLKDSYAGSTFFDGFDFISARDPTHGYVTYLNESAAQAAGLVKTVGAAAYMGVDYTNKYSATAIGRPSVRIETKNIYNHGLFIADIAHMPGNACGSWPAFWSLGDGVWPAHGEIDIIEGVNKNTNDLMVLHTADGCSVANTGMTGTLNYGVCDVSVSTSGCSVTPPQANTFGTNFNTASGGVYAMEWTSTAIRMWFFPRTAIPASITLSVPDTSTFGTPTAQFAGSCDIDTHFQNHKFIFDTTFCGDWAGNVYGSSGCPQKTGAGPIDSCVAYVGQNPSAFAESYWLINSFKAYTALSAVSSTKSSTTSSKTSTKISTSTKLSTTSTKVSTSSGSSTSTKAASTSTKPSSTSTKASSSTVKTFTISSNKASSSSLKTSTVSSTKVSISSVKTSIVSSTKASSLSTKPSSTSIKASSTSATSSSTSSAKTSSSSTRISSTVVSTPSSAKVLGVSTSSPSPNSSKASTSSTLSSSSSTAGHPSSTPVSTSPSISSSLRTSTSSTLSSSSPTAGSPSSTPVSSISSSSSLGEYPPSTPMSTGSSLSSSSISSETSSSLATAVPSSTSSSVVPRSTLTSTYPTSTALDSSVSSGASSGMASSTSDMYPATTTSEPLSSTSDLSSTSPESSFSASSTPKYPVSSNSTVYSSGTMIFSTGVSSPVPSSSISVTGSSTIILESSTTMHPATTSGSSMVYPETTSLSYGLFPDTTCTETTMTPYETASSVSYGIYSSVNTASVPGSTIVYATTSAPYAYPTASTSAKEIITTVITTSYVDVCPTGYVTSVITQTVTYCPGDVTSGAPGPGFTTKVTVCEHCEVYPTTVTLTVPNTVAPYTTAAPVYSAPVYSPGESSSIHFTLESAPAIAYVSSIPTPAPSASVPAPYASAPVAYSAASSALAPASSAGSTKIIYQTVDMVPVPVSSLTAAYTASLAVPSVAVVTPVAYSGYGNSTAAYPIGTAAPSASYTSPETPYFTGAATRPQQMGVVGLVGAMVVGLLVV